MSLFVMDNDVGEKNKVNVMCDLIETLYKKYEDDSFMTSKTVKPFPLPKL